MSDQPPRIFISYAQESGTHSQWVLGLASKLRGDGLDARIDQYEQFPSEGWRAWMTEQIERANWVLIICTNEYKRRFDNNATGDCGRGVRWESQHITQVLYEDKFQNTRFVPVLPPAGDKQFIPVPLRDYPNFRLYDGYEALYRLLTNQPATPAPVLGDIRRLPPLALPEVDAPAGGEAAPSIPESLQAIYNPYPGLAAFKPEGRQFFFGRDDETACALERLMRARFISVVGRSGTGKSSLIAAGVVPALRDCEGKISYLRFKPQTNPFRQLAQALDHELPEGRVSFGQARSERIMQLLEADRSKALHEYLSKLHHPILLFADQFEELFIQTPPETAREFHGLFEELLNCDYLYMVVTLRSEFMHRLMEWLGGDLFAKSLVPLEPITREDRLRAIISRPAEVSGVNVQSELVSALIPAARSMAGALPLIALTLERLFDQHEPLKGMTLDAYHAMGGLRSVVESAAAEIEEGIRCHPELEHACERLFAELATVIDDLPTRRTAEVQPLRADSNLSTLVEALRAQGFLSDIDDAHIEFAHETLLQNWPRLNIWCERYSTHLSLRRQAEQAANDWQKAREKESQYEEASRSNALRWSWERQKPTLAALLALNHLSGQTDPDFIDAGIHAWFTVESVLEEPLRSFLYPEPLRLLAELNLDETPHHRREEIGLRLQQMGDPRRGVGLDAHGIPEIVWIDIPEGFVNLADGEAFQVNPFRIAKYPITWQQYGAFLDAEDGYRKKMWWYDGLKQEEPGEVRWGFLNYPAINVSWYDAVAFCRWLSDRLGLVGEDRIRLPKEWEWQWVAGAGAEKREYPWRGGWHDARANSAESGIGRTVAVGLYPLGAPDPWVVTDLAGNVSEWCMNEHTFPHNEQIGGKESREVRGGSWRFHPTVCFAAYRDSSAPNDRSIYLGFRVCCSVPIV